MRKKLLALVMCATMVLGTAVTAVAAPLKEDYDNAKKIFDNGSKVITEMTTNGSKKQVPVTVNVDLEGGVAYGFNAAGEAVRLNDEGKKALAYIGKIAINKTKKTNGVVNASVVTTNAIADATAEYGADAFLKNYKAAYVTNISSVAGEPAYKVAVVTLGGTTLNPTTTVAYYSLKNAAKFVAQEEDADFMSKDMYSYDETDAPL